MKVVIFDVEYLHSHLCIALTFKMSWDDRHYKINDVIDNIDCTKYICMIFIMVTILHLKF